MIADPRPKHHVSFFRTSLFRALMVQIPVFISVFLISIYLTNRSMEENLYSSVSQKASLALANLRTATSMLIKDGKQTDLQRLIENAGASRMVKRIRLISAFDHKIMVSTDPSEKGQQLESPLIDSLLSKHSLLEMTDESSFAEGFEAMVPVSGSLFNTVSGADTIAVLQYIADMHVEKAFERDVFLTLIMQNGFLLFLVVVIMFITWELFVSKPLRNFLAVTNLVTMGDYSVKIVPKHTDEFAAFAVAFNQMIWEIGYKNEELFKHSETLEARVAERTESLYKKTIELEESQQRVMEAERSALAGRIAGGVAHEINNPSGFIMSNLETLKGYIATLSQLRDQISTGREISEEDRSELDWVMQDSPALIEESLDGMHRIVRIVRNLEISAYPDRGGCIDADITDILGRAIEITCATVQREGRLIKRWEPGLHLHSIPILCESALTNILQNAVDHVGETGTIELSVDKDAHHTLIRIANTGTGIPVEIMPYLFEPFFTTKAPGKGTGLGLSISKAIIEKAGGSISVESETGRTVFTIALPLDPGSV